MKKKLTLYFVFVCMFLNVSLSVRAAPGDLLFGDDFLNRTYIDEGETTAVVDVINGEIVLPYVSSAGGIAAGNGVVLVQNGDYVDFYQDQGSSFIYQSRYSATNTLAIALRGNSTDHFRLNEDGTGVYMAYTGSDYIPVPSLQLSGLDSVVSVSWINDKLVALDMEERKLRQFQMNGGGWTELTSISLGIENPIQVISKGSDIVVLDQEGGLHVYAYRDEVQAIPVVSLSGSDAAVITSDNENRVMGVAEIQIQEFEVEGSISQGAVIMEPGAGFEDVVALSPGSILVRDGNSIFEYVSTGENWLKTGRSMTGTGISSRYLSPRAYVSTEITLPYPLLGIQVLPQHSIPAGTNIDYYASIEGGPWELLDGGPLIKESNFQQVRLKGVLSTSTVATPRLQKIDIYDRSLFIDQFIVTHMVRNPGNPLPTSAPVSVNAGYRFDFEVVALGADEVVVSFSDGSGEIFLNHEGGDRFTGSYYFTYNTPLGSEFDVFIRAKEYTNGSEVTKTLPKHFLIVDSIYESANIYTTE